jgi:hypothetical protein
MITSGFMMLIAALPLGVMMTWLGYRDGHLGWHWSLIGGVVMLIAVAGLGGLFLFIGNWIVRRHWKKQKQMIHDDAA